MERIHYLFLSFAILTFLSRNFGKSFNDITYNKLIHREKAENYTPVLLKKLISMVYQNI